MQDLLLNIVVEVRQHMGANCYCVEAIQVPSFFSGGSDFILRSNIRLMTGHRYAVTVPLESDEQGVWVSCFASHIPT